MELLSRYRELLDSYIGKQFEGDTPESLYAPVQYILQLGGKRFRPVLCLSACELYSGKPDKALPAAFAIELFHNFTLVHDDIMDAADIRRGKPTVYKKYNANAAILSGDVMLVHVYRYLEALPAEVRNVVQPIFTQTAIEVCKGQQMDIDFENRLDVNAEEYIEMIRLKTAVLPAAALQIGALIGGAPEQDAQKLYEFGLNLGLAFQLQDDYLDTFGEEGVIGKKVGGDILQKKKTYLFIKALQNGSAEQRENLMALYSGIEVAEAEKVRQVTRLFQETGASTALMEEKNEYHRKTLEIIESLELPEEKKKPLHDFAEAFLVRTF